MTHKDILKKANDYCKSMDSEVNEHGVYIYQSAPGNHKINLPDILVYFHEKVINNKNKQQSFEHKACVNDLYQEAEYLDGFTEVIGFKSVVQIKTCTEALDEEISFLNDSILKLKKKLKDSEKKLELSNEELSDTETQLYDLELKFDGLDIPTETFNDQAKFKILTDLGKNLTLEQLEKLEKAACAMVKIENREYISLERIVTPN